MIPITLLAAHEEDKGRPETLVQAAWYSFQVIAYMYLFYTAVMQLLIAHHVKIVRWKIWRGLRRILAFGFFSSIFQRLLGNRFHGWLTKWLAKLFWFLLFLTPGTVFLLQIFFAVISLVFTLAQKFARPRPLDFAWWTIEGPLETAVLCSLNTPGENNSLGFGQLLALAFLALPVFMAYETYTGM